MIELDELKSMISAYEEPLEELRGSLLHCGKETKTGRAGEENGISGFLGES